MMTTAEHARRRPPLPEFQRKQIAKIKAKGRQFLELLDSVKIPPPPGGPEIKFDELDRAAERVEEAVFWALKHFDRPRG